MKSFSILLFSALGLACSTFNIPSPTGPLMGKSFDWEKNHGFAVVNRRHLKKTAVNIYPGDTPASWTSKYGSLTYNQHGLEFPLSGMNEKGLSVEILWLDQSEYAKPDSRPSINELQWVQYQLDNFASLPEVLLSVDKIRLRIVSAKIHYMVCDALGECATIEFLGGKSVVHTGATLPYKAITNDNYEDSLKYLRQHEGFGGTKEINPTSMDSLDRFTRVVAKSAKENSIEGVFAVLSSVKAPTTVWNLAYEPLASKTYFRTTALPDIRSIQLTAFNFSCKTDAMMLDMEEKLSGDVTAKFERFNAEKNNKMIRKSMNAFPASLLAPLMEKFPASVECKE